MGSAGVMKPACGLRRMKQSLPLVIIHHFWGQVTAVLSQQAEHFATLHLVDEVNRGQEEAL